MCIILILSTLFLDMNAYFASAEQQLRPGLRGLPVAVVPTANTDRTCCIAVSYEARPFGVKTGTGVREARERCPKLHIVEARPEEYVRLHHRIISAVETVLPVEKVCSIDEMYCRLSAEDRSPNRAVTVANAVKHAISIHIGHSLRCSIGLASNHFLGKVGSNMQKPNGLTVIRMSDLPQILYPMALDDFPGIARGMLRRLNAYGIQTVEQLCALSRQQMREAWRSVVGEHWWHWLRGEELETPPTKRQTVGHSHVLPPKYRNGEGAYGVMIRLIHKAAERLRRIDYWARRMQLSVSYLGDLPKWKKTVYLGRCQDTQTMLRAFNLAWQTHPANRRPLKVAMTLVDLTAAASMSLPLFEEDRRTLRVAHAMDAINAHFGTGCVYFASMHTSRETAPMRISFTNIPEVRKHHTKVPPRDRKR